MNKHAQEKIASEFYNMGIELALQSAGLGMSKTANKKNLLMGVLGGMGGAAAYPTLKGLGADALKYLRETASVARAPQIMEDATLARFAENLGQGNIPSSFAKNLAATENISTKALREAAEYAEAMKQLEAMKGFAGMGGDTVRGLGNFMQGQKVQSMLDSGLSLAGK